MTGEFIKEVVMKQLINPIKEKYNHDRVCIIMRGIPGSGKSTIAKLFEGTLCSADLFFTSEDGNYKFDTTRLKEAHIDCFCNAVEAMRNKDKIVVIDNTSLAHYEYKRYVDLAENYDYPYVIITVQCDLDVACSRGIHDVPFETMQRMQTRMEQGTEDMTEEIADKHIFF